MSVPDRVTLIEAGARDGLQNEPKAVSANVMGYWRLRTRISAMVCA